MARLLPPEVAVAEWWGEQPAPPLPPAEAELVRTAAPGRRRQFALTRACARDALARLGVPPAPVLRGPDREPLWPAGVVGSLTHCAGYGAAAVAPAARFAAVGVDAEPNWPLPDGVLRKIALPEEREWAGRRGEVCRDRLLFSAKESVFKAWFPLARTWLGFADALLAFDPAGTFTARLLVPGPVTGFEGRYAVVDGLVLTAIAHPPPSRGRAGAGGT